MEPTDKQTELAIIDAKVKVRFKSVDILRELAKRPEVRMQWSTAKNSGVPWFPGTVSQWNPLQRRLVYWSSFYNSIDGAYERPPDRIIWNDKLLDKWLESKGKEAENKYEADWAKGSAGVQKSAYDQSEVWEME